MTTNESNGTRLVIKGPAVVRAGGLVYRRNEYGTWEVEPAEWHDRSPMIYQTGSSLNVRSASLTRHTAGALAEVLARYERLGELTPPTRVCKVNGLAPEELEARGVIYVGRQHRRRDGLGKGAVLLDESEFHNPYRLRRGAGKEERVACVNAFREHLRGRPDLVEGIRRKRGCVLGCWCGEWDGTGEPAFECHAVALARVADGLPA